MAASTPNQVNRCRLLELPQELRDEIWAFAVISQDHTTSPPDKPVIWVDRRRKADKQAFRPSGLFGATRQIRREVMPIYYTAHRFQFQRADITTVWLKHLRLDSRVHVNAIFCCPCRFAAVEGIKKVERAYSQWSLQCKMFGAKGLDVLAMLYVCKGAVDGWFSPQDMLVQGLVQIRVPEVWE